MEDDDLDINSEEAADPFGNGLYAARIALNDNQLVYAQNWPTLDAALDGPSLASADDFRVLAEAISEAGDPILVAFYREFEAERAFFPGDRTAATVETWTESLGTDVSDWGILPPSPIFALVDYQDGDDQINAIALVYDNVASAEIAAGELTHRLETVSPKGYEEIGATIDPPFIHVDESGYAAVLASVRYPLHLDIDFDNGGVLPESLIQGWRYLVTDGSYLILASEIE
jgi:hypothetical protein